MEINYPARITVDESGSFFVQFILNPAVTPTPQAL